MKLNKFWEEQVIAAEQFDSDYKVHPLPLARIKKVMKSDPEVKMISAEAPILFSKACEIFICEITRRAWMHAEENKRRTLQRSDVASAVSRSDQFDFLIDIVLERNHLKQKDHPRARILHPTLKL
ncbi:histone-fold-containing protein [Lobosporangium transversale]|uniref:Histone-fold-containing protein n=1 Tax=Lobosporangium transversale TaxID=64571 RepID=A0A1Y2GJS5_9FUNG|nr:histone-fold-containing protein [Lobosporangium transversale]XP_021879777.1 histone-fold-containing protein [Lobosporangium transversale]ORZ11013.1 histone-fold-containing protein [Lobosporangium transversale]ORZ11680.1 histone-fold-containing protein [Lobosporangium transversale]|eukprot:XP_021879530.1 histone-fold-containing protein [Lobosporangium transversale]